MIYSSFYIRKNQSGMSEMCTAHAESVEGLCDMVKEMDEGWGNTMKLNPDAVIVSDTVDAAKKKIEKIALELGFVV